ncbi:hypothetical protein SAMN05446934_9997 [Paraburkholderia hospita]|nr:hypothetical protein SAMN05446934_9997 [Paraburkholderia hospita]
MLGSIHKKGADESTLSGLLKISVQQGPGEEAPFRQRSLYRRSALVRRETGNGSDQGTCAENAEGRSGLICIASAAWCAAVSMRTLEGRALASFHICSRLIRRPCQSSRLPSPTPPDPPSLSLHERHSRKSYPTRNAIGRGFGNRRTQFPNHECGQSTSAHGTLAEVALEFLSFMRGPMRYRALSSKPDWKLAQTTLHVASALLLSIRTVCSMCRRAASAAPARSRPSRQGAAARATHKRTSEGPTCPRSSSATGASTVRPTRGGSSIA